MFIQLPTIYFRSFYIQKVMYKKGARRMPKNGSKWGGIEKYLEAALDPPKKVIIFFAGICAIRYFFSLGDTTLIQNMKNVKSKFLIDL